MTTSVIRLPRPSAQRPGPTGLGFDVRAGRNDHNVLLDLLATGEEGIFGFVVTTWRRLRHSSWEATR